jgi:NADH-quinone oxidoreductase subunit M
MLKMGPTGCAVRVPALPAGGAVLAPVARRAAVIGIIYGALVAMVQPDMKKLVAYSSVSHLGFVVLGIAAMNTQGCRAPSTRCSTTASAPAASS